MNKHVHVTYACLAPLVLAGILVTAAWASDQTEKPAKAPENPAASAAKPDSNSPAAPAKQPPAVVAKIGEYEITKDDLIDRLLAEIRPHSEDYASSQRSVSVEAVLLTMVAEKATIIEGRKTGALDDSVIQSYIERQRRQKLGSKVVIDYIRTNLTVSEAEIDQMMKDKPQITREQASSLVQRAKGIPMLEQFYKQLLAKFQVKPAKENFAKASEIHQRLLLNPAKPRNESWILNAQVRDDVTKEEKGLVLANYDGGQVTLKDWLETLCETIPPRRPTNLDTPEGVEQLLDKTLRSVMLVAEAKSRGYDKDPQLLHEIRDLEDQQVLYKLQGEKIRDMPEPNDAQIGEYFEKHKDWFAEGPSLKADQIWCQDLATARKAKEELDGGKDFRAVKEAYSLQKNAEPSDLWRNGEGPFWNDLWKGEPNQVVGPIKGFHEEGLAWRVVKILAKTPAKEKTLAQAHDPVKWTILSERRKALLDGYGKELRDKYGYELYADRIQGLDPLDVTIYPQQKKR